MRDDDDDDDGEVFMLRAKNLRTGEERTVPTTMGQLRWVLFDGVDRCSGPCECSVEPDGYCPNGWPAIQELALAQLT